jgi:tetratricopeptide (TPR) repeat protein
LIAHDDMTSPEEYKEAGSKAYRENDFQKAISDWTNAIAGSKDPNLLKVVYSNRSAAYLKLKQYILALADGEKCVSLDSTWSKGYTRKGDALYSLTRYTEAFNAYNSGLRIAAPDEKKALQEKAEQAMRAIRGRDDSGSGSASSSTEASSGGKKFINHVQRYIRICIFISLFCYMIPVSRSLNMMSAK